MPIPQADSINDLSGLRTEVPAAALAGYLDVQTLKARQDALRRWPMLRKLDAHLRQNSPVAAPPQPAPDEPGL